MVTKKTRKNSGWRTPRLAIKMKYSEMIKNAEEPRQYYDDWLDYRDGMRDWPGLERKKIDKIKRCRIHRLKIDKFINL